MVQKVKEIRIRCPFNLHTHLRNSRRDPHSRFSDANRSGRYFKQLVNAAACQFAIIGAMPNTSPALTTRQRVTAYNNDIKAFSSYLVETVPIMQITRKTTVSQIREATISGIALGKVYPEDGVTYSAGGGLLSEMGVQLRAMQDDGMRLLSHLEVPGLPPAEREAAALPMLREVRKAFPDLWIVVEHVSTAVVAEWILSQNAMVGGSIALQHLWFTAQDLEQYGAHLRCAPIVKTAEDQRFLRQLMFSGNPKFWLIDDNAPHPDSAKARSDPPSGVYWGRHTLEAAATLFEAHGALDQLEKCVSVNPSKYYGVRRNSRVVTLEKRTHRVPRRLGPYRTILAGQELAWKLRA